MSDTVVQRSKIWTLLITIFLGPSFGMMYLNKGVWALRYLGICLAILIVPFGLAHIGLTFISPITIIRIALIILILASCTHALNEIARSIATPMRWYTHWYVIFLFWLVPIISSHLFRTYLYEPFDVPSRSMEPTINYEDYFFVSKRAYDQQMPQRGDIIVFATHKDGKKVNYVKRIIGLPGDTIEVKQGRISINGRMLDRVSPNQPATYIETLPEGKYVPIIEDKEYIALSDMPPHTVSEGHYFVVGDNRTGSMDSRNKLGDVAREDIIGKALAVMWNKESYHFSYKPL
jgi:signal peptidase I